MAQSKIKLKKFLSKHPKCCFCGGATDATTMDHVPARAFFIDRKWPKGMEFPACSHCQNTTTSAEDIVRLISIMHGTTQNPSMKEYYNKISDSFLRGAVQRKPQLTDTGLFFAGNPILSLGPDVQEKRIVNQTKLSLALYYRITGKILGPTQCMSLLFPRFDRVEEIKPLLAMLDGFPSEEWADDPKMRAQFFYRFHLIENEDDGHLLHLATCIHGILSLVVFLDSEDIAVADYRNTLRGPFSSHVGT